MKSKIWVALWLLSLASTVDAQTLVRGNQGLFTTRATIGTTTPGTVSPLHVVGLPAKGAETNCIFYDDATGAFKSGVCGDITGVTINLPSIFTALSPCTSGDCIFNVTLASQTAFRTFAAGAVDGVPSFQMLAKGHLPAVTVYTDQANTFGNFTQSFSGSAIGTGWQSGLTNWGILNNGTADFRYLTADELHVKVFISDLERALAGSQIIAKSVAIVATDFTCPAAVGGTTTIRVYDLPGAANTQAFAPNDWVLGRIMERGIGLTVANCWGIVTAYADGTGGNDGTQTWTFTRQNLGTGGGMTVQQDALLVDFGTSGDGFVESVANGVAAPYLSVATWSGTPTTVTTRARVGNLTGITGNADEYGGLFGDYTGNQYFLASNLGVSTRGVNFSMFSGATEVLKLDRTAPSFALGNPLPSSYGVGTGVWMGNDGGTYKFRVGNPGGSRATWDGTTFNIVGNVTATQGTIGGWTLGATTLTGTNILLDSAGTIRAGAAGGSRIELTNAPAMSWYNGTTQLGGIDTTGIFVNASSVDNDVPGASYQFKNLGGTDPFMAISGAKYTYGTTPVQTLFASSIVDTADLGRRPWIRLDSSPRTNASSRAAILEVTGGASNGTVGAPESPNFQGLAGSPELKSLIWARLFGGGTFLIDGNLVVNGSVLVPGGFTISGTVATANSLSQDGTNCGGGTSFALGIDASGNAQCGTIASSGTVTSVGLTMPGIFSVAGTPVTTSGTFVVSLATQAANTVWAGPSSGGAAAPTFRALVDADIPDNITITLPASVVHDNETSTFTLIQHFNGGFAVDSTAFTVADATGNTSIAGTLTVGGATQLNGGLTMDSTAFTVADTTGNTSIAGTLAVTGSVDLKGTVADSTGNVTITDSVDLTGTLAVTGAATISSTLGVTGNTTLGGDIAVNGGDVTSSTALNITPTNDVKLNPGANVVFDPAGNFLLPQTPYDLHIGSVSNKFLTLSAAELWVDTLVAHETMATIGGRILVGPTTTLEAQLLPAATSISVKHNEMANGDVAYLEGNGQVEFVSITSGPTPSGSSVSFVDAASGSGATITMPTHQSGDTLVIFAWRSNSTTAPSLPAGWSAACDGSGSSNSGRVGYKTAASGSETSGTWTNATHLVAMVFRGAAGVGTTAGGNCAMASTTTNNINYPAITLAGTGGASYVARFGASTAATNVETVPTASYTNATSSGGAAPEVAGHYAGPTSTNPVLNAVTVNATGNTRGVTVEILGTASGPYTYTVTRDLDGTGANTWEQGDALFNTGTTGDGFLDVYSISGVKPGVTAQGPTIVGNRRTGTAYNAWSPVWAIGHLNGLYSQGAGVYGAAFGDAAGRHSLFTATDLRFKDGNTTRVLLDATNLDFHDDAGGLRARFGASGVTLYGGVGGTNPRMDLSATGLEMFNSAGTRVLFLDGSGNATFSGALSAATGTFSGTLSAATGTFSGTITGGTIQTVTNCSSVGSCLALASNVLTAYGSGAVEVARLDANGLTLPYKGSNSNDPLYAYKFDTGSTSESGMFGSVWNDGLNNGRIALRSAAYGAATNANNWILITADGDTGDAATIELIGKRGTAPGTGQMSFSAGSFTFSDGGGNTRLSMSTTAAFSVPVSAAGDVSTTGSILMTGNGGNSEFGNFGGASGPGIDATNNGDADFLVYEETAYLNTLYLGYSVNGAVLSSYDSGEVLQLNTNGSAVIQFHGGAAFFEEDGDLQTPGVQITNWTAGTGNIIRSCTGSLTAGADSFICYEATSSRRYKENIAPSEQPFARLFDVAVVDFDYVPGYSPYVDGRHTGLIAEDVHAAGLTGLVGYGADGQPDYVHYDRIGLYLLPLVQEQRERIADLERRLAALEAK